MKIICSKCNRKFTPIFDNHIYNGSESIIHGNESVLNGLEYIYDKKVYKYSCPYCGTFYKAGYSIKEKV